MSTPKQAPHTEYVCDIETYGLRLGSPIICAAFLPILETSDLKEALKQVIFCGDMVLGRAIASAHPEDRTFWNEIDSDGSKRQGWQVQYTTHELPFFSEDTTLWANGVDFDKVQLEEAMRHQTPPRDPSEYWHYRQWMDLPTIVKDRGPQAESLKKHLKSQARAEWLHHPVYDCLLELALIQECYWGNLAIFEPDDLAQQWLADINDAFQWWLDEHA